MGLFSKKTAVADMIFTGGRVYTQDPDNPWCEAVAVRDGLVLALGDDESIEEYEGADTEVVDLEGGLMLPGFIDIAGCPAEKVFADSCLFLKADLDVEGVRAALSAYIESHSAQAAYFAIGFDERILKDLDLEGMIAALDGICEDKAIVMLGRRGASIWVNRFGVETVRAMAAEEGIEKIGMQYIMNCLAPIDFENVQRDAVTLAADYCRSGFTTVFNTGAPDYFDNAYQDILSTMLQMELLKQRYFSSFAISTEVDVKLAIRALMQRKVNCSELGGFINCNTLKITLDVRNGQRNISEGCFAEVVSEAAQRGFHIRIDAYGTEAVEEAIAAIQAARKAGGRKSVMLLTHEEDPEEIQYPEEMGEDEFFEIPEFIHWEGPFSAAEGAESVTDLIDMLTVDAAELIGEEGRLGSIVKGKEADFVIFEGDPFDLSPEEFKQAAVSMTVIGGRIVYEAGEDNIEDWYDALAGEEL